MSDLPDPGYVRIGSALVRLDGTRARLERSFQAHLRLYAEELRAPDLADPDVFVTLIQAAEEMRIPRGRLADLCEVSSQELRLWVRGRDLPDREGRGRVLARLMAEVAARLRALPDLSLPDQAASRIS
ncbi:hypothetical protein IQ03_01355 [Gemmobacter caeni]|uniref:Uncharacterized protein n=1 Tax=Gemmobacter caeni TaxID=589035 RepID=A0A2T6B8P4_9RHOB|nr:hypothetical protein [Gemmobacter caeni]PTX52392.1 hypothetical protein C8N34_102171 [Gemmobacter caeni]TWJ02936.1 hypothetical protein IQ03_01355 [Gemmobacter caeni]